MTDEHDADRLDNPGDGNSPFDLPLEQMAVSQEPPFDPEDTPASGIYRVQEPHKTHPRITERNRFGQGGLAPLNLGLYGAALLITMLAGFIYLQQGSAPAPQPTDNSSGVIVATGIPATATSVPNAPAVQPTLPSFNAAENNVPLDVVAQVLLLPGDTVPPSSRIFRQQNPYTIAPAQVRDGVEQYTIQPGDNMDKISARFGITTDTIAWANDGLIVNLLTPGDKLTIPPENGVLYKTQSDETIQAIANKFKASAFTIIDSEDNQLQNANPSTLLPAGFTVMVPGGTSIQKLQYWSPQITKKDTSGKVSTALVGDVGFGSNAEGGVSFGGGPGSCGFMSTRGAHNLRVPLGAGYTVVRGFYPGHTGIDLAAPTGTTVFAAADGTVIFSGWSNWGYGNSIVLAHGPDLYTLYGHLSAINVRCGQFVSGGTPIGAVGTT
ncbi:MAG TPA: M23 family metallopeptidase, partial [Aggregatilineales bacterium]|nr:M23 family metallopeptidase [Aggregatilineales bacterium]